MGKLKGRVMCRWVKFILGEPSGSYRLLTTWYKLTDEFLEHDCQNSGSEFLNEVVLSVKLDLRHVEDLPYIATVYNFIVSGV